MKEKQEHIFCDYCGKTHEVPKEQAISVNVAVGRQMDAAGGSESVFLKFDLCPVAAAELLYKLIDRNNETASFIQSNVARSVRQ